MNEAEMIEKLIGKWVIYSKAHPETSLENFSTWLNKHLQEEKETEEHEQKDWGQTLLLLGHYFGRLVNFSELWAKVAFKDLPIRKFEDYAILSETYYKKSPTKNELASLLVNEKSTIFEIIKRLIREDLLEDFIDENDKRIRRVQLTSYGKQVFQKATVQAGKVAKLLMGDLPKEDIIYLSKKFKTLDQFHTAIYTNNNYETIDDLI